MRLLIAYLLFALCGLARADDEAERAQIKQKREAVETRYTEQQETCRKRFVVTSCLEKARADRLEGLKVLRAQEAELDDAVRRERARAQAERVAEKAKQAESRDRPKPAQPPKEPRTPKPKEVKPPKAKASASDRSAEEQRQREAFEARQREIKAHREEIEKRNAERKPPPRPLPVPASADLP
jgi:colicin import membrane protein